MFSTLLGTKILKCMQSTICNIWKRNDISKNVSSFYESARHQNDRKKKSLYMGKQNQLTKKRLFSNVFELLTETLKRMQKKKKLLWRNRITLPKRNILSVFELVG